MELGLDEFNTLHIDINNEYAVYEVEPRNKPIACTLCAYTDDIFPQKFKLYDTRIRTVSDVNDVEGRKVIIKVHQHRYTCPYCGKVFTEYFNAICRRDKVTVRLWERLGKEVLTEKNTFRSVGRRYGVSPTTVTKAFKEHIEKLDAKRVLKAPVVLGIDEVYVRIEDGFKKKPLVVFTDIENGKLLEIINQNDIGSVIRTIKSMQGYENIKAVAMDMNSTYRNAAELCIPSAYCVVDHYHVMQKVNMALDTVRSEIQKKLPDGQKDALFHVKDTIKTNREKLTEERRAKLDEQLELYPKLKTCYWLKEQLRDVYKCKTKKEAYGKYYEWECKVNEANKHKENPEMKGIQKMINKVKHEIFNFFDDNYTNALTERLNRDIKDMVRDGNGYHFETLRAKALYGTKATQTQKWKNMNFTRIQNIKFSGLNIQEYEEPNELICGFEVDMQQLCKAIENGEIGL